MHLTKVTLNLILNELFIHCCRQQLLESSCFMRVATFLPLQLENSLTAFSVSVTAVHARINYPLPLSRHTLGRGFRHLGLAWKWQWSGHELPKIEGGILWVFHTHLGVLLRTFCANLQLLGLPPPPACANFSHIYYWRLCVLIWGVHALLGGGLWVGSGTACSD